MLVPKHSGINPFNLTIFLHIFSDVNLNQPVVGCVSPKVSLLLSWFQLSRLIDAVTEELLNFEIDTFESITDYTQQTTVCGGNLWKTSLFQVESG